MECSRSNKSELSKGSGTSAAEIFTLVEIPQAIPKKTSALSDWGMTIAEPKTRREAKLELCRSCSGTGTSTNVTKPQYEKIEAAYSGAANQSNIGESDA